MRLSSPKTFVVPIQLLGLLAVFAMVAQTAVTAAEVKLLNVSYDPTRPFYKEFNAAFAREWKSRTGDDLTVYMSHGGSGKQGRAILDGLPGDVLTLALADDIDMVSQHDGGIAADWRERLPNHSVPSFSTIVLVVRKGNPKGIRDWSDLARPDVAVVTPNPKTSGGARWNYLALWEYGRRHYAGEAGARDFVQKVLGNVELFDTGARASTMTFVQRRMGDVLISWESEAHLLLEAFGGEDIEIVNPSLSVRAEAPVTVVDRVVARKGTRKLAEAYLGYLWSEEAQEIALRNHYRVPNDNLMAKHAASFGTIELFSVEEAFGGWEEARKAHFGEGGSFDQLLLAVSKKR